jgi:hypothetical protein
MHFLIQALPVSGSALANGRLRKYTVRAWRFGHGQPRRFLRVHFTAHVKSPKRGPCCKRGLCVPSGGRVVVPIAAVPREYNK